MSRRRCLTRRCSRCARARRPTSIIGRRAQHNMIIRIIATIVRALWVLIEYPYLLRYKVKPAKDWDRHSAKLWDAANAIELVGMVLGFTRIGRIQMSSSLV